MDVLSDVLLAVRLSGAVFFDVSARTPFAVEAPASGLVAERVMPQADHVIGFHMVTEGSCWTEMVERPGEPVLLQAGDMVIYPAGDANIMASRPGMRAEPALGEVLPAAGHRAAVADHDPEAGGRRRVPLRVRVPGL